MSLKNSAFVALAATALGLTVSAGASPICEGMLNDVSLTTFGMAEIDSRGRVAVIIGTTTGGVETLRPVCDVRGDVRLYSGADAAVALSKRATLAGGVSVKFVRMEKAASVGDPVATLKAKHKNAKVESASAGKSVILVAGKISAAASLGWDVAVGTPEAYEYADLVKRQASVGEWDSFIAAKLASYTAALVAAGIDPVTYLPV